MNRNDKLRNLVDNLENWPKFMTIRFHSSCGWDMQDNKFVHTIHDPITIHDWNRAKIEPNTKIETLSPEHSEYVQKLAFEAGFAWRSIGAVVGHVNESWLAFWDDMYMGHGSIFDKEFKQIYIEMPEPIQQETITPMHEKLNIKKEDLDEALKRSIEHEAPDESFPWPEAFKRNCSDLLEALDAKINGDINARVLAEKVGSKAVNNPSHYQIMDGIEAIDIIAASLTLEQWRGYCLGNILKYRLRAGKKDATQQDIDKANKYEKLYLEHADTCKGV